MLFPIDNASRQVKELNGIWQFKQEQFLEEGFKNKWYENGLENTIEMPVPASYNDITTDRKLRDHVGWVWYERMFSVPKLWENQRIVLRFVLTGSRQIIRPQWQKWCRRRFAPESTCDRMP